MEVATNKMVLPLTILASILLPYCNLKQQLARVILAAVSGLVFLLFSGYCFSSDGRWIGVMLRCLTH